MKYPRGTAYGDIDALREESHRFAEAFARALLATPLLGRLLRWMAT